MEEKTPALYGIKNSNRNFSDPFYWGKNQFNSAFPMALACYMRDLDIPAMYIKHVAAKKTEVSELGIADVFGTQLPNEQVKFLFESTYTPFAEYVEDSMEHIDVVLEAAASGAPIRPLEIKLTTLPDDGTSTLEEEFYGSELVIRSPTMRYMALSMGQSTFEFGSEIKKIFEGSCRGIRDWGNLHEMLSYRSAIFGAVECFLEKYHSCQRPLMLQPIWKTIGKSPRLADNCLDMFVWSDFSLARLIMDGLATEDLHEKRITRPQRAALRFARFLYEFSKAQKVFQKPIYDGMTFDTLNDKEFAVPGRKTNKYMKCPRLLSPIVTKGEIKKIILGGGQKFLSPERRFDSILYFSKELFDE